MTVLFSIHMVPIPEIVGAEGIPVKEDSGVF